MNGPSMTAVVQSSYGTSEVLEVREVPVPAVGEGDVLVRVRATSVNAADLHLVTGLPRIIRLMGYGMRAPKSRIRGADIAGVVESVGAGVTSFRPGDEVYAQVPAGGFAELVLVAHTLLAAKPATLTFEQAAAVPLAANTALQGLRDRGELAPGQTVLINGASGGVGTFAVQLAKAFGGEVTGVCSSRNVELVRSLGADHVVDYSRADFATGHERYDLVLDLVANRSLATLRRAVTPTGTLVLSGGDGGSWVGPIPMILAAYALSPFAKQRLRPLTETPSAANLRYLAGLLEAGTIAPAIERTFALGEAAAAVHHLTTAHARGKVVIVI